MDEQRSAAISNSADTSRLSDDSVQGPSHVLSQVAPGMDDRRFSLRIKNVLCTAVFAALLLAGLAAYGVSRYGSLGALASAIQGRVLYVEPQRLPLGVLKPREHIRIGIRLHNLANKPIKVLGSHSIPSCGCLVAEELPVELVPGEVKEVPINLKAPANGPAKFEIVVTFYTNMAGEQPHVVLHGQLPPIETEGSSASNAG